MFVDTFRILSVGTGGRIVESTANGKAIEDVLRVSGISASDVIDVRKVSGLKQRLQVQLTSARTEQLAFCDSLVQLLDSGLTLSAVLAMLTRQKNAVTRALSESLLFYLKAGFSPAEAFEKSGSEWPRLLLSLLRAGERNGELSTCLGRYCALERRSIALRKKLISASVYPASMLFFSSIVLVFLFVFVIPKFSVMIDDSARQLPFASRLVFSLSNWVSSRPELLFGTAVLFCGAVILAWQSTAVHALGVRAVRVIPAIAQLIDLVQLSRTYRMVAALVNGGLPITVAMERALLSADAASREPLIQARMRISQGERPSKALLDAKLANDVESQLIASAESGGQLGPMLDRIAQNQEIEVANRADRLTGFYSPALLFVVAMIVGVVVVSLYWPLLDVFDAVK